MMIREVGGKGGRGDEGVGGKKRRVKKFLIWEEKRLNRGVKGRKGKERGISSSEE